MTSLFTMFAARGVEMPAIDPRLVAHFEALEVDTTDTGPAAPDDSGDQSNTPAAADQ